ncbi:glycosyltransferase [Candidatus Woesearchaeota archaeon]|nr:glycosyltransferase [Candidatus Woesearchaeota archaeon]
MKKLVVLIPCYNEEKGIGNVIDNIPIESLNSFGYEVEILVIDNNSKDKTSEVAKEHGANVIFEEKQGKGNAVRKGFNHIKKADIIVMIDGDLTYNPKEMIRIIEPIDSGFCNVVIGSRLCGRINGGMSKFNRLGNWFFSFMVRLAYNENVTDVCTGYFAWNHKVIKELKKHLTSEGFSLEMEMLTKMSKMGYDIFAVPISYDNRMGQSTLRPAKDGYRIMKTWVKYLTWKP